MRRPRSLRTAPGPCTGWARSRHRLANEARSESIDELIGVEVEDVDSALAPRLALDGIGLRRDGPRAVVDAFATPQPVQEDANVPRAERIAEEQEVAAAELGDEADRNDSGQFGRREEVDVVVLADDEALPFPLGSAVDLAVDLEDHRAALGNEVNVRVRDVDERDRPLGRDVQELACVTAGADVA